MLRKLAFTSLTVAGLSLVLASSAWADVAPGPRDRKPVKLEPHSPPPMTPPAEDPVEPPEPEVATPPETEPAPTAEAGSEAKAETKPEAKTEAKPEAKSEGGRCSVDDHSNQTLLGLAGLVLLISGASLRRRRTEG